MTKRSRSESMQADYSGKPPVFTLFGWCMTGHHDGCIIEFTGHTCNCNCHGSRRELEEGVE